MILIADSGSTKTHWCVVNNGEILQEIFTDGINPFFQTDMDIIGLLDTQLIPKLQYAEFEKIHFYGAGCSFPEKKFLVSQALVRFFVNSLIEIQSDLLAAARSLFQHEKGIACILGTGSNSRQRNYSERFAAWLYSWGRRQRCSFGKIADGRLSEKSVTGMDIRKTAG